MSWPNTLAQPYGLRGWNGSGLGLGRLAHLAEHLRRRRLVEADRVVVGAADHSHSLEHAQHAEPGDVGGQLGLVEAEGDEADGAQVVHLVGLRTFECRHQRRQVRKVTRHHLDERQLLEHGRDPRVALALHHPVHLVATAVEELGEVLAVLAGDPRDEGAWQRGSCSSNSGTREYRDGLAEYRAGCRIASRYRDDFAMTDVASASHQPPFHQPLRVAIDVGPLYGHRTGVGVATAGLVDALRQRGDVVLDPYLVSFRARPADGHRRLAVPGIVASRWWSRHDRPGVDRWAAGADVIHGTNYVVPPSRIPSVVSVYDCWFVRHPELASAVVRRAGERLRRAVAAGAFVHASSAATAAEVAELFGTDRVEVIPLGLPPAPPPLQALALAARAAPVAPQTTMVARARSRRMRSACGCRNFAAADGAGPGCSAARRNFRHVHVLEVAERALRLPAPGRLGRRAQLKLRLATRRTRMRHNGRSTGRADSRVVSVIAS